ncbi:tyrosine-type recombinase/integrase [Streptomyces anthocyanicus]|uniref:tyrosine-type recombinase/integrase n=1 Tax=Streptomyces anthocyanicus TaxID=68174 RepID=UPI003685D7AA
MARVWIEDRIGHAAYMRAVSEAKRVGRTPPGRYRVRWYGPDGKPKMKTLARKVDADQRFFAPAVTRAGLGHLKVTPHKLRHTAASLAIASGADVNVVQTMLGHKSATLTLDTYGHLFPDRLDEVSKKMHKRRSKQLAKVKAKLEKAERKAREAAETVATLEEDAA